MAKSPFAAGPKQSAIKCILPYAQAKRDLHSICKSFFVSIPANILELCSWSNVQERHYLQLLTLVVWECTFTSIDRCFSIEGADDNLGGHCCCCIWAHEAVGLCPECLLYQQTSWSVGVHTGQWTSGSTQLTFGEANSLVPFLCVLSNLMPNKRWQLW